MIQQLSSLRKYLQLKGYNVDCILNLIGKEIITVSAFTLPTKLVNAIHSFKKFQCK